MKCGEDTAENEEGFVEHRARPWPGVGGWRIL